MTGLAHLAQLDVDPVRLVRTLRRAGLHPSPPAAYGAAGVCVVLGQREGSVLVSQDDWDGDQWVHASIAWTSRMPTYEDLATLKAAVFGPGREAYQVFPPESRHVNIHAHALHLYGRADGARVLPNFAEWGTI
jgi:hypothetical protein